MYTGTNVFATPEELEEIKKKQFEASRTPVMTFSTGSPDMASVVFKHLLDRVHELALAHGLPEHSGYYGLDTATGEFVKEN